MPWRGKQITIDSTSWTPVTPDDYSINLVFGALAPDGQESVAIKVRTALRNDPSQSDPASEFTIRAGNELALEGSYPATTNVVFLQTVSGTVITSRLFREKRN